MISGTFVADFAQFYDAVQKADVQLRTLSEGAAGVEKSLNRMVDSFTGRKVISEATIAAEAVDRIGGVAKLTETELASLGRLATEAASKIKAMGQGVPEGIQRIVDASTNAANATKAHTAATQDLQKSFNQVDSILGSLGINLGQEVKGLGELAGAAGKSAGEMGLLGTAGLAVGAGVAAWGITRAAMEFFDLDKSVANAWSRLLGFGDAAKEAAAANADVLAKASAIAGRQITDLTVAMGINAAAAKEHTESFNTSAQRVALWSAELKKVSDDGALDNLKQDLEDQNSTLEQLHKQYGISVEALQYFQRENRKAAEEEKAILDIRANNERKLRETQQQLEEDARKRAAAEALQVTKIWDDYYATRTEHGGTANAQAIAQVQKWAADTEAAAKKAGIATDAFYQALAANSHEKMASVGVDWDLWKTRSRDALQETADNALKTLNAMIASGQFLREDIDQQRAKWEEAQNAARGYGAEAVKAEAAARQDIERTNAELAKRKKIEEELADIERRRQMGGSYTYDLSTREGLQQYRTLNPAASVTWSDEQIMKFIREGGTLQQLINMGVINPYAGMKGMIPGFASGIEDFMGGLAVVGEKGPELVNLPAGADVIPADRIGSGRAPVLNVSIKVNGVLDGSTTRQLARAVGDEVMRAISYGRKLPMY